MTFLRTHAILPQNAAQPTSQAGHVRQYWLHQETSSPLLDEICRTAAEMLEVPIALITVADGDQVWVKGSAGFAATHFNAHDSFCQLTIASQQAVVIPDAQQRPEFSALPLVKAHKIHFYAGIPILAEDGALMGTFCVMDRIPRSWGDRELQLLQINSQLIARTLLLEMEKSERERLAEIISHSTNGFIITDREGRTEWINQGFTQISGYTLEEMKGRIPGELLQGAGTDPKTVAQMRSAIAQEQGFAVEIVNYHRHTRQPYWVEIRTEPLRDLAGKVTGFLAVQSDITERKLAETSLRQYARRLEVINSLGQAILHASAPQEIATIALEQLSFFMQGCGLAIFHLDPWAEHNGGEEEQGISLLAQGGEDLLSFTVGERLPAGEFAELIPGDGRLIYRDLSLPPSPGEIEASGLIEALRHRGVQRWLAIPLREDSQVLGGLHIFSTQPMAFSDEQTNIAQELANMVSLAIQQAHFEQHLIHAKEEAEELNRLKSIFLANMSHEIRTPLTAILGFTEMLAEDATDPHLAMIVETIQRSSYRLLDTLSSVLDLAQLESKSLNLHFAQCDLVRLVQESLSFFEPRVYKQDVSLCYEGPPSPLMVETDEAAFVRILNNLISNAVKFTDRGAVTARLISRASQVVVEIQDTGVGISAEFMDKLFDEFTQESDGINRRFEGTGLGLAITKRLVELLRGDIEVESQRGQGSTFRVILPTAITAEATETAEVTAETVAEGAEATPAGQPGAEQASGEAASETRVPGVAQPAGRGAVAQPPSPQAESKPTLLVVEDQPETRHLLQLLLSSAYRVVSASTLDEAMKMVEQEAVIHLFLVDISLNGPEDGLILMQMLRQHPRYADAPIIACTAYGLPSDEERFLNEGFSGYLSKPFTKGSLLNVLKAATVS